MKYRKLKAGFSSCRGKKAPQDKIVQRELSDPGPMKHILGCIQAQNCQCSQGFRKDGVTISVLEVFTFNRI